MAGMFDDLIPGQKSGLDFSDLVPSKKKPSHVRKGGMGEVLGGTANLYQSIPLMDEGAAALDSGYRLLSGQAKTPGEAWRQSRELQTQNASDFQRRRPTTTAVIKGAGTGASVFVPAGGQANVFAAPLSVAGRVVPQVAANAARGATLAAGNAYLYSAADKGSLRDRAQAGTRAASDPLTLALGGAFGAIATPAKPKPGKAPTRAELTAKRKEAYAEVKASGQKYTPEQFGEMVQTIKRDLAGADFDPDFQPTVATMLKKLDDKAAQGYAPTLQEMDDLRKFIRKNVASTGDKNVRRLGTQMISSLDNYLDGAGGSDALKQARQLYGREQKVIAAETALDKARRQTAKTGSGGNIDNATRQRFDRMLETTPNLTADERAALESIVYGDMGQNTLRQVGKLSPQGNGLMTALTVGGSMLNPALGAPAIAGLGAKAAADRMTQARVRDLIQLIAAGGTREQLLAIQRQAAQIEGPAGAAIRRLAAARLSSAAGAQGGARTSVYANPFAQP